MATASAAAGALHLSRPNTQADTPRSSGGFFGSHRLKKITQLTSEAKQPSYRVAQIHKAIFSKLSPVTRYTDIPSIPSSLQTILSSSLGENIVTYKKVERVTTTQTMKALLTLQDEKKIEAVHMTYEKGNSSICISSQVGCALACSFCSTGAIGFKRNLTTDEIVDQVLFFLHDKREVDSISFMGMGEPLLNPNVYHTLDLLTHKDFLNFSPRKISVSTVGVIPGIERMTSEFPNVNLAFSLHTPFHEQRTALMPANKTYPLPEVLRALDHHAERTRRKVFLSYLILDDENDSPEHAKGLLDLIAQRPQAIRYLFHVNLLRFNPALGLPFSRPSENRFQRFLHDLTAGGVSVSTRQSFGVDIDAACGQLYAQYDKKRAAEKR